MKKREVGKKLAFVMGSISVIKMKYKKMRNILIEWKK